ncbi:MAG: arsenate reductase (glutaredoxin) [Flavobacteriales bacterium]
MLVTIYHNPRCRKSREALQILNDKHIQPTIVEYLKTTLDKNQLTKLVSKLAISPIDLVRTNEAIWKDQFKGKQLSDKDIITAMVENPKLIERPIVVRDEKAVIARPPELVLEII